MLLFMTLIIPMPHTVKRKLFNFISESPLVAKLQYGMKVNIAKSRVFNHILNYYTDNVYLHIDPVPRQRESGISRSS